MLCDKLPAETLDVFIAEIADEQDRLVRLCAKITGSPQSAEDLAQETLLIAWQKREKIYDANGINYWLTAIARNVCRRWLRNKCHEQAHHEPEKFSIEGDVTVEGQFADDFDVTVELEREELATLLDRAMALLPVRSRSLLVQHYLEELPQAELAERFGMSRGAIAVGLYRGRVALRQVLLKHFRDETASYGFVPSASDEWQKTYIWCFQCGQHRLLGQRNLKRGILRFLCPGGCTSGGDVLVHSERPFLREVKSYKPAYKRNINHVYGYYIDSAKDGAVPCQQCGRTLALRIGIPPQYPSYQNAIYVWCEHCNAGPGSETWVSLAQCVPAVQTFWRKYPRMRALPLRLLEYAECPAIAVEFESITDSAQIEVIFARNTVELVHAG